MVEELVDSALAHARANVERWGDRFPSSGEKGHYRLIPNENWLAGFWTGILWLAYGATQDPVFRRRAESLLPSFARRLDARVHLTHDLGFLFSLSALAQWRLTGNENAGILALRAAGELTGRFKPQFQGIQAWDGDENAGRII
ncbi:MAG TPA: glucuronyl hydrolase, partial [Dehalococcoidia bacterium]|nr:glucuronyl hydrolase [Dehalococcoidia bacterium]